MTYQKEIQTFYKKREKQTATGQMHEKATAPHFHELIKAICAPKNYFFHTDFSTKTQASSKQIFYDAQITASAGLVIGYIEDKDPKDNLDKEVLAKKAANYEFSNILFQNMQSCLLIQNEQEVARCNMDDIRGFDLLLQRFIHFKDKEALGADSAFKTFKEKIPYLAKQIKNSIKESCDQNPVFKNQLHQTTLELKDIINQDFGEGDLEEMVVQHILSEDIFLELFSDKSFLEYNPIAKNLEAIKKMLGRSFDAEVKANISPYYQEICQAVKKQGDMYKEMELLRMFYEEFYKAYNPQSADRYGIVYTPWQVVDFMVDGLETLLREHFGKNLGSPGVHILDPCTGTGTFMAGIMNSMQAKDLEAKYEGELHANEISILAYYIGNLYIERVYAQKTGGLFREFKNMCFVDTLDNIFSKENMDNILSTRKINTKHGEEELFAFNKAKENIGGITKENSERVKAQNQHPLLVILGNPPYNRQQQDQNENNKNKLYKEIDARIKATYIKNGEAQNMHMIYDMYVRFIRWASDRVGEEGIVAFITNRSFLDAKGFDGFRKTIFSLGGKSDFTHIYTLDLGGDVRKISGKILDEQGNKIYISGKHTLFGDAAAVGVAITFFVKAPESKTQPTLLYANPFSPDALRVEKLNHLVNTQFKPTFAQAHSITPNTQGGWLNQSSSNFNQMLPLVGKEGKALKEIAGLQSLFVTYSLGVVTARDNWVYDENKENLEKKVHYFIDFYNKEVERWQQSPKTGKVEDFVSYKIKWSRNMFNYFKAGRVAEYSKEKIVTSLYRPFQAKQLFFDFILNHDQMQMPKLFPTGAVGENTLIAFNMGANSFATIASHTIIDYATLVFGGGQTQCIPLHYTHGGQVHSNITPQGHKHYPGASAQQIFAFVYALLHSPRYRQNYKIDLAQNLPRVPVLDPLGKNYLTLSQNAFNALATLGQKLLDLHLNWQNLSPLAGFRVGDKENKAYKYKLGTYSAIDWALYNNSVKTPNKNALTDVDDPSSELYTKFGYTKTNRKGTPEVELNAKKVASLAVQTLDLQEQIDKELAEFWGE